MTAKEKWILALALMSYMTIAIDGSIVFTGLTEIACSLRLDQIGLSWVQNAYVIAFGGFLLFGGRLSDALGRRRLLLLSLTIFLIGSVCTGCSVGKISIACSRFIQGIGSAMMAPASLALIMDYFTGIRRVKAVAWYASVSGIGLGIGLIIGGAVTHSLSWRYVFFLNVPLVAVMYWITLTFVDPVPLRKEKFDVAGVILSMAGIFCLNYAIDGAARILPWLIAAALLLALFVFVERAAKVPIMPLGLFRSSTRAGAYLTRGCFVGAMMGFNFFISEFMQRQLGYTPFQCGLAFIPMTSFQFLSAMMVPRLVECHGNRRTLSYGLMISLVGFVWLLSLSVSIAATSLPLRSLCSS